MTKKYCIAIAEIIKMNMVDEPYLTKADNALINDTVANIGRELASFLVSNNPKFDREKFLIACGIE